MQNRVRQLLGTKPVSEIHVVKGRVLRTEELGRQGVDATHFGGMVYGKSKVVKKTRQWFCEYMQCHSARVPKKHVPTLPPI